MNANSGIIDKSERKKKKKNGSSPNAHKPGKQWKNKILLIYAMGHYSTMKENDAVIHAIPLMNLEIIMLNERSLTKVMYSMISFI